MNKQQALVGALEKMRGWESPVTEEQVQHDVYVFTVMREGVEWLAKRSRLQVDTTGDADAVAQDMLMRVAGAALYLLVDELEIVEGRTLDEWLAGGGGEKLMRYIISPPVNGEMGARIAGSGTDGGRRAAE